MNLRSAAMTTNRDYYSMIPPALPDQQIGQEFRTL